ncbi:FxsA family protein [Utexia brackfieldae]|uniref:FxsA family protein n=1 Tax=Utexia brackfieldae TaxID=3074108 RepID=UPI00370DB9DE
MRLLPLFLLFLYVYLEVSVFIMAANHIGVLLALLALIATSIVGVSIVKSQGLKNIRTMQQKMQLGENANREVQSSVTLLAGGFLLLIPGFITDVIGACLLLPPVQQLVARFVLPKIKVKTQFWSTTNRKTVNKPDDDIIEGSFSRKNDE